MTDDSRRGRTNPSGRGDGPRSGGTGRGDSGASGGQGNWRGRPDGDNKGGRGGRDGRRGGGSAPRGGRGGDRGGRRDHQRPDTERRAKDPDQPPVPESVTAQELDAEIRQELITLPKTLADHIARHLVMVGTYLDEDPERAHLHAVYARKKASRVGAVREASGLAAYRVGNWQEALADLRAARRMSGRDNLRALMADCERGLGRPERALELVHSAELASRPDEERVELRIVAAGARRDLGESEAALVELNGPELQERRARPWAARLFYVYAEVLLELGREDDAREYFAKASAVDAEGDTDADERLAELEGLHIVESDGDITWTDAEAPDT